MQVRAKFRCIERIERENDFWDVRFSPVYNDGEENARFFKATPSGELRLGGVKGEVAKLFVLGEAYYLDLTPQK